MKGIILTAGLLIAASFLIPVNTTPPDNLHNSSVSAEAQTATSKVDEIIPHQQQPSPETVKPVEPEKVPSTPKELAQVKAAQYGWVGSEWDALVDLWQNESGWNPKAVNEWSGACGIVQALPCSKIPNPDSVDSQIEWGLNYIQERYGSPSKALYFWHNEAPAYNGSNWY